MPSSPVLFGLTALGVIHTIVGLAAITVAVGAYRLDKEIRLDRPWGRTYLALTFLTAASALFIMQHGGFNKAHGLALLTLGALAVGLVAARGTFGGLSRYVAALCFGATLLFHAIPGVTETLTRLPPGAPIAASAEAPKLPPIFGALLVYSRSESARSCWRCEGVRSEPSPPQSSPSTWNAARSTPPPTRISRLPE
jgi:uncharacterized membrane protein